MSSYQETSSTSSRSPRRRLRSNRQPRFRRSLKTRSSARDSGQEAAVKGPLISATALAASSAPVSVLDVRWSLGGPPGRDAYGEGHIPGAVYVDLDTELAGVAGARGRHPLPEPDDFQAAMQAAGVDGERPVVVYDAATSMAAARAWWLLRYFGHPEVAVLEGGLAAWAAGGYPISTEAAAVEPGHFVARSGGMPVLTPEEAAALTSDGVLLDVRAPERFRGEAEPVDAVAGHIPGAHNLPVTEMIQPSGAFRDRSELRALFASAGAAAGGEIGAYCGSGVAAAQAVLALELAGLSGALYPGSWSEWIADPKRPVATSA